MTVHVLVLLMYASNELKTWWVNVHVPVLLMYMNNKMTIVLNSNLNPRAFLHVLD